MPLPIEIQSFLQKFEKVDLCSLGIEPYPASYGKHIIAHLDYYATIYKTIIDLAVQTSGKPVSELTVLDYGAGNGFLGMFAQHYGFKKVWINDFSDSFLNAAKKISAAVQMNIDDYILGDISAVRENFTSRQVKPDLILSTDVIEHIYDLNFFFGELKRFNPDLIHVFTTASNPHNYFKIRKLHKVQYTDEWIGYKNLSRNVEVPGPGKLSFYEQRKKIIKEYFPQLSDGLISELAATTRGRVKQDIVKRIHDFVTNGEKPVPPTDPFWVCEPETGSWTERILPVEIYKELYRENGFSLKMFNGLYNENGKRGIKRLTVKLLNNFISANKQLGKYWAPYIILLGTPI